jgi:transposase
MLKTHCQIILLSAQHYSVPQIAGLVFYSEDMVADTIHLFNRAGLQGLIPQPKGGRPAKLTADWLKKLLELVESDPRDLGYDFSSWTAGLLAAALQEQMGVQVSASWGYDNDSYNFGPFVPLMHLLLSKVTIPLQRVSSGE